MSSVSESSTPTSSLPGEVPEKEPQPTASESPPARRPRGFAAMDPSRVSEIARRGGKAAHAAGTAHQFSKSEAADAGRKGGIAPHVRRGRAKRAA